MAQNQGSTISIPLGSQVRSQNPLTFTPSIRPNVSQTFTSANNYSTVQPVNYNLQNTNTLQRQSILPSGVPMQSHVRASRVLEPIYAGQINVNRQTSTAYTQPNVTYTRPNTIYTQPIVQPIVPLVMPTQTYIQPMAQSYVRPVTIQQAPLQRVTYEAPPIFHTPVVVRQIAQSKVQVHQEPVRQEKPIKVQEKVVELPPQVVRTVQHERPQQAIVETARQSRWEEHYTKQKILAKPPITAAGPEQPTICKPWLWGIIGLLALAGLITGLVLALKGNSGYGTPQSVNTTQSQGIKPISNYQPIQNTNSTGNSTTIANGTVIATPIYTDILVTPPQVIQKPGLQTITTSNKTIMVPTNGTSVIPNSSTNINTFNATSTSPNISSAVIDVSQNVPSTNTTTAASANSTANTTTNKVLATNATTSPRHYLKRAFIN